MSNNIFNAVNKLKNYSVKIGDIDLIKEVIISLDIIYTNRSPIVLGKLVLNDFYDLNLQISWRDVVVSVFYMDMYDEYVKKVFVVTSVREIYDEKFKKTFTIELQDAFSYVLEHSFLSKSFSIDIVSALNSYISELNLSSFKMDFSTLKSSKSFVVPSHINNLNFFIDELFKRGFNFYQNKQAIVLKHMSELIPSSLVLNDPGKPYINETNNQHYKNRILALRTTFMNRNNIVHTTKSISYDPSTKSVKSYSDNSNSSLYMNDDEFNLQTASVGAHIGKRTITQPYLDFSLHRQILKNSFLKQSELEMAVNGFVKNDINQIYELVLKGNIGNSESEIKGNMINNGKYICNTIIDKILGDSFVQKIYLHRADMTKKI